MSLHEKLRFEECSLRSGTLKTMTTTFVDVGGQSRTTTSSRRPWLHRQRKSAAAAKLPRPGSSSLVDSGAPTLPRARLALGGKPDTTNFVACWPEKFVRSPRPSLVTASCLRCRCWRQIRRWLRASARHRHRCVSRSQGHRR